MMESYFQVKKVTGGFETAGLLNCVLGHQLEGTVSGKPEGVFARWSWDGKRFHLENDRYGYYPVFYFARDGEFCISTSIPKLLEMGAPRDYDDTAMSVFIRLGFFLGDDTPFRSIRAVPADASFNWEGSALQVSGSQHLGKLTCSAEGEAVDAYITLFREAMQRRLVKGKDFALPLTGGRDSRHMLLELCRIRHEPNFTVTFRYFPPHNDSDVDCAAQLSGRLGIPHVVLDQPPSLLKTELRKNLKTSFCSDEHAQYVVLVDYLKTRVGVIYDGIGVGVFARSHYRKPDWLAVFRSGDYRALARQMISPSREHVLKSMLTEEAYKRFNLEAAIQRLSEELERYSEAPNPPGAFNFWVRTRREISLAPYAIYDEIPLILTPYMDNNLFDFMSGIPPDLFKDCDVQSEAIKKEYPKFADVPYETKGVTVTSLRHFRKYARDLLQFVAKVRECRLVRRSYLIPRLVYCQLNADYCTGASPWLLEPLVAYLLQLDDFASGRSTEH